MDRQALNPWYIYMEVMIRKAENISACWTMNAGQRRSMILQTGDARVPFTVRSNVLIIAKSVLICMPQM